MTAIEFYDSGPGEWPPGAQYAALYADSSLAPGYHPQQTTIPNKRYITRRGGAVAAAYAGIADYESGNLVYVSGNLGQWAAARHAGNHRFRVYCSRSDVHSAYEQVRGLDPQWWIATGDGNPDWTPAKIVASVRAITGVSLPEASIWGIQWAWNSRYDTSYLTGEW